MDIIQPLGDTRIRILPQLRSHAREIYPLLLHPALYRYTGGEPPSSPAWLERRFELLESRRSPSGGQLWLNWVVQILPDAALVGYVQATVEDNRADIAWVIGLRAQGRGYATRAASLMLRELDRLDVVSYSCHIHPAHRASNRVAEKLGFRPGQEVEGGEVVWLRPGNRQHF